MDTKFEILKAEIYNTIKNYASKEHPIQARKLYSNYKITFRELKKIITDLRNDYPIVAKETNGGGYWIAENEEDIIAFIQMIQRRKQGYEDTIRIMNTFLADYGSVPYLD